MREVDYAQAREENLNNMTAKTDRRLVEKHRQYYDQQSAYEVVVGEVILSTKRRRVSSYASDCKKDQRACYVEDRIGLRKRTMTTVTLSVE